MLKNWLILFLFISCIGLGCYVYFKEIKTEIKTIEVTKEITLTDIKWDTCYIQRYDTIKTRVIDTLIEKYFDSIYVELPINTYKFDTIVIDSNSTTQVHGTLSGFNVAIDSLFINTKIMNEIKQNSVAKRCLIKDKIGFGVGVGYGTNGVGVMAGIMFKLF